MVKHTTDTLDLTFSALADPTRRRILESLSHREWRVTDLAEPFSMSLPAVSKHLGVLEKAGLLKRRRIGREHYLKLEAAPMRRASSWIEHYRKFWEGSLDNLARYLESTSATETKPVKKNRKGKKA
jgi:DNA-binding transcriptional ArsR family regulator